MQRSKRCDPLISCDCAPLDSIVPIRRTMSLQQAEKPPPYSSDVKSTSLPSVPTTEPTTLQNANTAPMASSKSVPSQVSSSGLANPDRDGSRPGIILQPVNLPAAPHHEPRQASSPQDIEMSIGQNDQTRGVGEADEDANDRMAAEALCGLGKAGTELLLP